MINQLVKEKNEVAEANRLYEVELEKLMVEAGARKTSSGWIKTVVVLFFAILFMLLKTS